MVAIEPPTSAVVIFGDENDEIVKLLNTHTTSSFLSLGMNVRLVPIMPLPFFQKLNITPLLSKLSSPKTIHYHLQLIYR